MNLENKKIPVTTILSSLAVLLIAYISREPRDYRLEVYFSQNQAKAPLSEYNVSFFGVDLSLKFVVILTVVLFFIGVYLFLFKDDQKIKDFINWHIFKRVKNIPLSKRLVKNLILIIITVLSLWIIIKIIFFYFELQEVNRPLSLGESIFIGFAKVFTIIFLVTSSIKVAKFFMSNDIKANYLYLIVILSIVILFLVLGLILSYSDSEIHTKPHLTKQLEQPILASPDTLILKERDTFSGIPIPPNNKERDHQRNNQSQDDFLKGLVKASESPSTLPSVLQNTTGTIGIGVDEEQIKTANEGVAGDYYKNLSTPSKEQINNSRISSKNSN